MIHIKRTRTFLLIAIAMITLSYIACKKDDTTPMAQATVEVELLNVGFTSWKVIAVRNTNSFAALETNNTAFTLEKGRRYQFISMAGPVHPFEFRNAANEVLLTQNTAAPGMFETNTAVKFTREPTGFSFTLTNELAAAISTYNCANHNGMKGMVIIK